MKSQKWTHKELQRLYSEGVNITDLLRMEQNSHFEPNTEYSIEVAYDLQTGSYSDRMSDESMRKYLLAYTQKLTELLVSLGEYESVLEAGVGEATILSELKTKVNNPSINYFGFDLSWSRVAYARKWLFFNGHTNVQLCTGSLMHIPFLSNSIDVVFTSHAIEPNAGREREILEELYRVANKYLILLEPCYERATQKAQERMAKHGYCRNLKKHSEELGHCILRHEPFLSYDDLNPTTLTVIRKTPSELPNPSHKYACPIYKTPLKKMGGAMFSSEALTVYPVVDGIPCLRTESGIIASKFPEIIAKDHI